MGIIKQINQTQIIVELGMYKFLIESFVNEVGEPEVGCNKILKIKIVRSNRNKWYANRLGDTLEAVELSDYYDAIGINGVISKEDAEVVTE